MSLRHIALGISCLVLLGGCGAELLTTTVITTELQAQSAKSAIGVLNYARDQTALTTVQQGIQSFQSYNGRNPQSLQELIQTGYLVSLPQTAPKNTLYYDPSSGSVWIGPVDAGQGQGGTQATQGGYPNQRQGPAGQGQPQQQSGGMVYMTPTGQMVQGPQYRGGAPAYPQGMARGGTESYSQRQMQAVKDLGF